MVLDLLVNKRKKSNKILGGIEFISPTLITGWIYQKSNTFSEVRLVLGPYLIASAKVNIFRKDVCEAINQEGNYGFSLILDSINKDYKKYSLTYEPKLVATTSDLSSQIIVKPINNNKFLTESLNFLFKEGLVGRMGHVDGISDLNENEINGWACDKLNQDIISIWMISEDQKFSFQIECNNYRGERNKLGIKFECGFTLRINELTKPWVNKKVNFFFDKKGVFPLPCNEEIHIHDSSNYEDNIRNLEIINYDDKINYLEKAGNSSEDLRYKWLKLNQTKEFLDAIDNKLFDQSFNKTTKFQKIINKIKNFKLINRK